MLPVQERFHAFQGEGVHMGRSAFFIRTYGCPVQCPWCDSAGTWHHAYRPEVDKLRMSVEMLVEEALFCNAEFVVVTGGEPLIHDLAPLVNALHGEGIQVHLETCGAFPIKGGAIFDWITLSPKDNRPPLKHMLHLADEFKIIVEKPEDIERWFDVILYETNELRAETVQVWLHPEWSQRENPAVLGAICEAVKGRSQKPRFRAGWQMHKPYMVDAGDARTAPRVPLGGDPARGY